MSFRILSHACVEIKHKNKALLVDPWLIGSCYWRSWWNYPPVKKDVFEQLKPDAIYITHVHWDHWHGPTLKFFLEKNIKIITHDEPNKRSLRDLKNFGFKNIQILSYAVKYASSFYGPFRAAIGSSGNLTGDKKTYQLDFRNAEEALKDVALDIKEGADMVMVKPGMPYLDICRQIKNQFKVPTFAYQVSGEYAMLVKGSEQCFFEREKVILETISCFKRAGCDGVLTYFALELAKILNEAKIS